MFEVAARFIAPSPDCGESSRAQTSSEFFWIDALWKDACACLPAGRELRAGGLTLVRLKPVVTGVLVTGALV